MSTTFAPLSANPSRDTPEAFAGAVAVGHLLECSGQVTGGQALSQAMPGRVKRYAVPGLRALKFVITDALPGGVYASLHAGLHWQ